MKEVNKRKTKPRCKNSKS